MTPYQQVVEWPEPKIREARKMYFQRYTVPEISKKTGIPGPTITGRIYRERWNEARDAAVIDIDAEARAVIGASLHGLGVTTKTSAKMLEKVAEKLDRGEDVTTEELLTLSEVTMNLSDLFLRVFNK